MRDRASSSGIFETTHNLVAKFNLGEEYVGHDCVVQERYIVCASWKTLGQAKVEAVSVLDSPKTYARNPHDDAYVVAKLHQVLSGADVIVAHNGDHYDIKFLRGRMLYHGLKPLPPIMSLDTLQTARSMFHLNSNRLDYLGRYLGLGMKKPTKTGLWLRVLKGDQKAVREMVAYNKQDVVLLERVFQKLTPYMSNYVNRQLFGQEGGCPRCGSRQTQARGVHRTLTQLYQRFQCLDCGGWFRERKAVKVRPSTRVL